MKFSLPLTFHTVSFAINGSNKKKIQEITFQGAFTQALLCIAYHSLGKQEGTTKKDGKRTHFQKLFTFTYLYLWIQEFLVDTKRSFQSGFAAFGVTFVNLWWISANDSGRCWSPVLGRATTHMSLAIPAFATSTTAVLANLFWKKGKVTKYSK